MPSKCKLCSKWGHEEHACGKKKRKGKATQKDKTTANDIVLDKGDIVAENKNDEATTVLSAETEAGAQICENDTDATVLIEAQVDTSSPGKNALAISESNGAEVSNSVQPQESTEEEKSENESALPTPKESNWLNVSPSKMGRSATKSTETHTVVSPSRFAILHDEFMETEEDKRNDDPVTEVKSHAQEDGDESEEGEIVEGSSTSVGPSNQVDSQDAEGQSIRRVSNRASKGINRNSAEFFAQSTKETHPRATSKKRNQKKH